MITDFRVLKQKRENGVITQYLLQSRTEKEIYCRVLIDPEHTPYVSDDAFEKGTSIAEENWQNLSDPKKVIIKNILEHVDLDTLILDSEVLRDKEEPLF